jgi:hypothetical protein
MVSIQSLIGAMVDLPEKAAFAESFMDNNGITVTGQRNAFFTLS